MPERAPDQDAEISAAVNATPAVANESAEEALPIGDSLRIALARAQDIAKQAGLAELTTDVVLLSIASLPRSSGRRILRELNWSCHRIAERVARRHNVKPDDLLPADMRPKR